MLQEKGRTLGLNGVFYSQNTDRSFPSCGEAQKQEGRVQGQEPWEPYTGGEDTSVAQL